ncbi:MAG TPA: zinc ribbon domain-containing protein [Terracidiphilus sp.]|nr:zinc ribbon domain-containing protein [Terracidiphilus sp.]
MHVAQPSRKTTMSFKHGAVVFDLAAGKVSFGKLPPVAIPAGLQLEDGATLAFQLVGPNGELRSQTRTGILKASDKQPGVLRIAGMAKSASKFTADNGWQYSTCKFRAYIAPPGKNPIGDFPEWIKASASRQRSFWNRLAYLCREARRKCSPLATEEIISFVRETILPAIDNFNAELGRSKENMRHPASLKVELPGVDGLWSFVGELRKRIEKGRAVPAGLLEKVISFAEPHKPDYTPLNEFLRSLDAVAEREARILGLHSFEKRSTLKAFVAVLRRRKAVKNAWSEGWPQIKYADGPKFGDWGIHYSLNKAGVDSSLLETGRGIPGLSFGPAFRPEQTGHPNLKGVAAARALRPAHISIAAGGKDRWEFDFVVLQHYALPANSHVKEWKLLHQDGKLFLCLIVEVQRRMPSPGSLAAGLDIGWRRTEAGIRFGTLFEPAGETIKEMTIDLQNSSSDSQRRMAFRINLGPNRWDMRNMSRILPGWKAGDPILNSIEGRKRMSIQRSEALNAVKEQLQSECAECLPEWIKDAGRRGMIKLREELKDNLTAVRLLDAWLKRDEQLAELILNYSRRATARLVQGQVLVAHDVCRYLQSRGISRLVVERCFLAAVSQKQEGVNHPTLERSQKYRQIAASGRFVALLRNTAAKYAIALEEQDAINTTRICHHCGYRNPPAVREWLQCGQCGRMLQQDHNAAINLSRLGTDASRVHAARQPV